VRLKRLLDLFIAVSLLLLTAPVLCVVAIAVRLKLGRPVLFRQKRVGKDEVNFEVLKFRTMTDARDADGQLLSDSDRLTKFGRWLRTTSLDELPELINVLKGDMSVVGPRPLLLRYQPWFTEEERLRFSVLPGITGLAQVSGRNDLDWDRRIALDVEYVRKRSLVLDLKLIWLTAFRVLSRHGLREDPGAIMLDFDEERRRRAEAKRVTPR
jgi:undecaprenyl phosphate N,N'-diacetylbacillosamine 1-phosphate transferase